MKLGDDFKPRENNEVSYNEKKNKNIIILYINEKYYKNKIINIMKSLTFLIIDDW